MRKIRLVTLSREQEFARDHPRTLVDELVEGMLAVCARSAPDHGASVVGAVTAVTGHAFAV